MLSPVSVSAPAPVLITPPAPLIGPLNAVSAVLLAVNAAVPSVTPPAPQAALTYSYSPDTTVQRWITTVTAAGIGSYTYKEDTKGRLSDLVNPFNQTFCQQSRKTEPISSAKN